MALTSITKDFITRAGIIVQGTAPVTSSTSQLGALQVNAGAAIAKNLIVGSTATIYGATTVYNSLNVTGVGTFENSANAGAGTGALVVSNGGGFIKQDLRIDGSTAGSSTGGALNVSSGGAFINGVTYIANTTAAASASSAALSVQGGVFANNNFYANGSGNSTDGTPALKLASGGALINKDVKIDGTTAASTGSAALFVSGGGAYINKELWVDSTTNGSSAGGALNVKSGGAFINNVLWVNDSSDAATTPAGALVLANGGAYIKLKAIVDSSDNTTGAGTGALQVNSGGAFVKKDVRIDGTTAASTSSAALYVSAGGGYIKGDLIVDGTTAGAIGAGALKVTGGANLGGALYVDNNATASNAGSGSGSLRLEGGAYIKDNLMVKSTAFDTGTNVNNALYVAGGAWIDKTLVVDGAATFNNTVYFNGTATYVYSTNTVYTDNLINVHVPPGGGSSNHTWASDDGKDIGLIFHYYKGTDKNSFLGFANDTTYLEWYDNGDESGGVFTGTSYGTFKTGSIKLVHTTSATSTATGALTVEGGVGIGGDLYVGGKMYASAIGVSGGGDIQATVSTATNLQYGLQGQIPIQYAPGKTTFIEAGTGTNQVLTWNTVTYTATWVSSEATVVGAASNVVGGAAGQIPFQSAPSTTIFDSEFNYDNASNTLNVFNINSTGTVRLGAYDKNSVLFVNNDGDMDTVASTSFGFNSGTTIMTVGTIDIDGVNNKIADTAGSGIEVYSADYSQLNWNNSNYVYVNTDGVNLEAPDVRVGTNQSAGLMTMRGTVSNLLSYPQLGMGAPTTSTWSAGTKIALWDNVGASSTGYAIGIEANSMWFGLDILHPNQQFKWYGGTTAIMTLTNQLLDVTGALRINTTTPTFTTATSGAVRVQGGVGIAKDIYVNSTATFDGIVSLRNTASSYSTSSNNALVVSGGVGVGADLYVANTATIDKDLYVGGTIYMKGVGLDTISSTTGTFDYVIIEGTGTGLTVYDSAWVQGNTVQLGASGANQLQSLSTTTLEVRGGWGNNAGQLSLFAGNYPTTYSKITLNGGKTITTEADTFTFKDFATTDLVKVQSTTASSSISSGAVVVYGGVGIQQNLNVGGTTNIAGVTSVTDTTNSTSTTTGAAVITGGVGIGNNLYVGGNLNVAGTVDFTNTTQAQGTGTDTGAVKIAGGLLVKKNIVAGGLVIGGDYMGGATPTNPANQTVEAFKGSNNMQAGFTSGVISGTSETNLDVFDATLYTTAKYIVQVKDGSDVHSSEILLIHNGTNCYLTEYGIITSNGELGTFGADLSGGTVTLKFVPTGATSMRINVIRTSILTSISAYAV